MIKRLYGDDAFGLYDCIEMSNCNVCKRETHFVIEVLGERILFCIDCMKLCVSKMEELWKNHIRIAK